MTRGTYKKLAKSAWVWQYRHDIMKSMPKHLEGTMTIAVMSAAKRLAESSDWSLTNLELQKITYLAHMFYMGRRNGEPLVHGNFEAWDYGPVHPDLYHRANIFGSDKVKGFLFSGVSNPEGPELEILDEAYRDLGHVRAGKLVSVTHRKGGAWENNYRPGARSIIIPNSEILEEYLSLGDGK